jgi:multiple sugar transport system substrate-binding protein
MGEDNMHKYILIACAVLLLAIAGCSGKQTAKLTIAIGGAPNEVDFWEKLIADFEQESGIAVTIRRQVTDTDLRRQELFLALRSKQTDPDVFLMDVVWIPQFVQSGWLQSLDRYMAQDSISPNDFLTRVVRLADAYNGHIMALPVYVDGGVLYYRTDLLEKYGYDGPPDTWQHLQDCAVRIEQEERKSIPDFYGFVWQGAQYEGLVCNFLEYAGSNGGGILDSTGNVIVDSPENVAALTFMHDLIRASEVSPPNTFTEMKEEEVRTFFQQGKALFERNWPYAWALHQDSASPVAGKVGIAPLPHFDGGHSVSTLGGWHVGISQFSDVKPEAWKLVEYIISHNTQKQLALNLGWNPGRVDVYDDPEVLQKMPQLAALREVFAHALPRPTVPYYSRISSVLQRDLNAALAGGMTPEDALSDAQKEIEAIVREYREK